MSQVSRSTFDTTYVNAAGTFADNSTREISEGDMRQYADDLSDSVVFKNDDYDYWIKTITASGTDTYTITPTVPVAYASDEKWLIRFTNSNTGPATLNRNSLGAKSLLTNSGGALSAGDIVGGGIYIVNYNGTNYRILNVVAGTGSVSGLTTPRIPYATSATTLGDHAGLIWDNTNAFLSVGAGASPDRQLHVEKDSAATNTVTYLQRLTSTSTGTPAAGIGVGMEFEVETAAGNNEVGATIEVVTTDVTATSEDFDIVFKVMTAGAAVTEKVRFTSQGAINVGDARIHTTGTTKNTFYGKTAGNFTNSGSRNIGIGADSLTLLSSGLANIVLGDSGQSITSGGNNIIVGGTAANSLTGDSNVIIGTSAGPSITTGDTNVALGTGACTGLTIGDYCIGLGYNSNAGTTGSNNISIGKQTQIITATNSNQLSIQNAIYGDANSGTAATISSGNLGFFANTWGTSAAKVLSLGIGTAPTTAITDGIQWFAKNSSDGTANATLGLYLEQTVEAIGTFTASHKLKIWINGTEYWIQLDAV